MFTAQPTHALLSAASFSGGAHVSTAHDEADVGAAFEMGAVPTGHGKEPTRHADCLASAYEPDGHALQIDEAMAA